jgi:hypothetical protein
MTFREEKLEKLLLDRRRLRQKYLPNADPELLCSMTCAVNKKCSSCRKVTDVCPVKDYQYASSYGGMWD